MTPATLAPLIGPEYDSFLSASIGDYPDGRQLSVLSAFARSDLDPWREATCLARMSREKALVRLTAFISTIPDRPAAEIPAETVALQLIALLPNRASSPPQAPAKLAKILTPANSNFGFAFSAIALLLALAIISLAAPKVGVQTTGSPMASMERPASPPLPVGQ